MGIKKTITSLLISTTLLWGFSCGDEDGPTTGEDTNYVCDPEGSDSAMNALINAEVDSDVEVVVKEPQHPGDPGPTDLP